MSDFAGLWRLDGRPIEDADLARLGDALDGAGLGPPRVRRAGDFAVVHRQSAFSPRERFERQPFVTPAGATLAADLRLVARDDLIRALDLPAAASQWPDGALLARALDVWPIETALPRLYGEYAFALWRPRERRLVLGRDAPGRRSLFVHRGRGLVAFSTRLRALLSLPEICRDFDEGALADDLVLNIGSDPARTLHAGIDRLPGGHFAVHTPDRAQLSAHWDVPEPGSRRIPAHEVEDAAREVLDKAVLDALECEGPPTALLTAGLDTANVAVAAARLVAPGRLAAATLVPGGKTPAASRWRFHDESPRAAALAAMHPNIDWTPVPGNDGSVWADHDPRGNFIFFGAPLRAPYNRAFFQPLVRFLHDRGCRVTLGGEMGNGFFSYDGVALLPQLFAQGRWMALSGHCRALHANGWTARSLGAQILRPFAPIAVMQWRNGRTIGPLWGGHSPIHPAFAKEVRLSERIDPRVYKLRAGMPIHQAREERRQMIKFTAPFDMMNVVRARTGIDHRPPLADRRVIEFLGSLPLEEFLRGGQVRSIARRLLRGAAPPETIRLESNGLQGGDWFAWMTAGRPRMQDEVSRLRASPLARRIVDLDRLEALLDNWPADADTAEALRPDYLQTLSQGLEMAQFLAWSEGSNQ